MSALLTPRLSTNAHFLIITRWTIPTAMVIFPSDVRIKLCLEEQRTSTSQILKHWTVCVRVHGVHESCASRRQQPPRGVAASWPDIKKNTVGAERNSARHGWVQSIRHLRNSRRQQDGCGMPPLGGAMLVSLSHHVCNRIEHGKQRASRDLRPFIAAPWLIRDRQHLRIDEVQWRRCTAPSSVD